jgi:hypothetical protein
VQPIALIILLELTSMSPLVCPDCQARLALLARLGTDASHFWQVGNRDGNWRGCAIYHSSTGRVVLCRARPVESTWKQLMALAQPGRG